MKPNRGELWVAELGENTKHKKRVERLVLVVSDDGLNHGTTELVIVVPTIKTKKKVASQIVLDVGEHMASVIKCETILSISQQQLLRHFATVPEPIMTEVDQALRFLLAL